MRVVFPCPLCREVSRRTMLEADLDTKGYVVEVAGTCAHAERFGELDGQTLREMWRVIEAALEARRSERPGS